MITAYTADNDLEAARREGLLAVLPKPVPIARLVALLGQRAPRRAGRARRGRRALADNLTEALRGRGFAAVTAASVLETERLGDVRPFAALVDLRVPGGPDGEAMRRLAATFPGLPMLVITALDVAAAAPSRRLLRQAVRHRRPARTPSSGCTGTRHA